MTFLTLVGLLVLTYAAAGQQQNYLDYDYQEPAPVRQPSPPQRSFSRPSPPQGFSRTEVNKPTPVPILKQINRHNDDGSYTYGYEGADGSFKIETKLPTGEVTGKYGYVDDTGKLRVVDYGANKYGFQPVGEGITVAPPTLVDESTRKDPKTGETFVEYDDGSYFEPEPPRPAPRPAPRPQKRVKPSPPARLPVHTPRTFVSYEESQQDQGFGLSSSSFGPSQPAYAPRPSPPRQGSPSPVPPRAAVPGAAPVGPVYKPQTFSAPVPVKPVREPIRDHYQPRSAPSSSSYLDQLAQQYALPQGSGQPLHDISFGSYTSQTHY